MRGKRKNCDDSEAGLRKQAKLVDDILEHTSRHDKSTKAKLLAKIIDRNGPLFGKEIKMKSKAIQQTLKLTPEQTASLMADNESDYRLKKFRTVVINGIGYSLIASFKKVDEVKKKNYGYGKKWNFVKMLIYQNKQGKNTEIPKETTVLMVKEILPYIVKMTA